MTDHRFFPLHKHVGELQAFPYLVKTVNRQLRLLRGWYTMTAIDKPRFWVFSQCDELDLGGRLVAGGMSTILIQRKKEKKLSLAFPRLLIKKRKGNDQTATSGWLEQKQWVRANRRRGMKLKHSYLWQKVGTRSSRTFPRGHRRGRERRGDRPEFFNKGGRQSNRQACGETRKRKRLARWRTPITYKKERGGSRRRMMGSSTISTSLTQGE